MSKRLNKKKGNHQLCYPIDEYDQYYDIHDNLVPRHLRKKVRPAFKLLGYIDALNFSLHTEEILLEHGINTIYKLCLMTPEAIHKIHTLGKKSEREIMMKLKSKNLVLGMDPFEQRRIQREAEKTVVKKASA